MISARFTDDGGHFSHRYDREEEAGGAGGGAAPLQRSVEGEASGAAAGSAGSSSADKGKGSGRGKGKRKVAAEEAAPLGEEAATAEAEEVAASFEAEQCPICLDLRGSGWCVEITI